MPYLYDHDYHIHSVLSNCSSDPLQNPARILAYAVEHNLNEIVLTDHFWDETVPGASDWYAAFHRFDQIAKSCPLPQTENVRFRFGCETDMNRFLTVGVSKERMKSFDFIIIPTTHLHMKGYTITEEEGKTARGRADAWIRRLDALLSMDLPFRKIGIAHLACGLIAPTAEMYLETLSLLKDDVLTGLFRRAAAVGVGIELNADDMRLAGIHGEAVLRMFRVAKDEGCRFYLGSDAHHPDALDSAGEDFNRAIRALELEERDRFVIGE